MELKLDYRPAEIWIASNRKGVEKKVATERKLSALSNEMPGLAVDSTKIR